MGSEDAGAGDGTSPRRRDRARRAVNLVTLATPLGLVLARAGHATVRPGPRGTLVAAGYRSRFPAPRAPALTVGDVILLRLDDEGLARRPRLLEHEARHADQWACAVGVLGFPVLYGAASLWSWLRFGDPAVSNVFERRAGLVAGGYLAEGATAPLSRARRRRAAR